MNCKCMNINVCKIKYFEQFQELSDQNNSFNYFLIMYIHLFAHCIQLCRISIRFDVGQNMHLVE